MRLKELCKKTLETVKKLREDEEKLIKEIVESSPDSIMYMGYVPVHFRFRVSDKKRALAPIVAELLLILIAVAASYLLYRFVVGLEARVEQCALSLEECLARCLAGSLLEVACSC